MKGTLYIDGFDIYTLFGVFITEGGYNGLLSFPSLKDPDKNDWHEMDGIEVDLSSPKLDTKTFSISFAGTSGIDGFMNFLTGSVSRSFNFVQVGITKTLRLVSFTEYAGYGLKKIKIDFADDSTLGGYSYLAPTSSIVTQRGYLIDSVDLSAYGVWILEGSDNEIKKPYSVKPNLIISSKYSSSVIYDTGVIKKLPKEVKLNCLLMANNLTEFWRNYNALLYNLTRANTHIFTLNSVSSYFYYKSSNVTEIELSGRLWCKFDLNLVFLNDLFVEP